MGNESFEHMLTVGKVGGRLLLHVFLVLTPLLLYPPQAGLLYSLVSNMTDQYLRSNTSTINTPHKHTSDVTLLLIPTSTILCTDLQIENRSPFLYHTYDIEHEDCVMKSGGMGMKT